MGRHFTGQRTLLFGTLEDKIKPTPIPLPTVALRNSFSAKKILTIYGFHFRTVCSVLRFVQQKSRTSQ
jgi:hypothetical protein